MLTCFRFSSFIVKVKAAEITPSGQLRNLFVNELADTESL